VAFAELSRAFQYRNDVVRASGFAGASGATGRAGDAKVERLTGAAGLTLAPRGLLPISATAEVGHANPRSIAFEQFSLGGLTPSLIDASTLGQRIAAPALPTGAAVGSSLLAVRGSIPLAGLSPYLWAGTTTRENGRYVRWHRVIGAEFTTAVS